MPNKTTTKSVLTTFQKISLFFFSRPKLTFGIWLIVFVFGIVSYTTLLKREGFPSVNLPFSLVTTTYLVNDAERVDRDVSKPISDEILKQEKIKSVQAVSAGNFSTVIVQFEEDVNAQSATDKIQTAVDQNLNLPEQAKSEFEVPRFGFTERGDDLVISFYSKDPNVSEKDLVAEANKAVEFLKTQNVSLAEDISIIDPFLNGQDPATGQVIQRQVGFDRYGERQENQNNFFNSVIIGATIAKGADLIEFDEQMQTAVAEYNNQNANQNYVATVSASFAPDIKSQISVLQKALLEGLLAALVVGALVIAFRASLITVISMVTVISITIGILFLIGYSLNTITLFALILGLALIVDDTIIMIEAIDSRRRRTKNAADAVTQATGKISRAMIAATTTAVLSFTPLLFVGGILGGFIRAIPVTVIIGLITSLVVALVFIPFFARYIILGKKQMGEDGVHEVAAGFEAAIARFIGKPMLWARNSRKKKLFAGLAATFIGIGFIMVGGFLFSKVTFNIFPPSKDSNGVIVTMDYAPGTTIEQAQNIADQANKIAGDTIGVEFEKASYLGTGRVTGATLSSYLTPFDKRDITAPQIVEQLEKAYADFDQAKVQVGQMDVGPPTAPFKLRIESDDTQKAYILANDVSAFLQTTTLTRVSGEQAKIVSTTVANPAAITRNDSKKYVEVSAVFEDDDTSTLFTLAQDAVKNEFTKERLAEYGFNEDLIKFDLGQEQDNQDSFKTLVFAFPIVLLVIFLLLSIQFRSLLQPALIFMAIPFSLFGITLGLYVTNNAFSFFAMLGFFALIGLSIKNTILLVDYANQARRKGKNAVDAVYESLQERFRPLIATSFTAVVALIPLALSDPFWEGLTVVLIFGLLSSTFLVVTVFPYYYLGAEFMRMHISRKSFFIWLAVVVAVSIGLSALGLSPSIVSLTVLAVAVLSALGLRKRSLKQKHS